MGHTAANRLLSCCLMAVPPEADFLMLLLGGLAPGLAASSCLLQQLLFSTQMPIAASPTDSRS